MYDVPPLGEPFGLRGVRDVALVLDTFAPTHLDAWLGRAVLPDGAATGAPSRPPLALGAGLTARALVVRHAGDVAKHRALFGRGRLDAVRKADPPGEPLLGVVVEQRGATLLWLPPDNERNLAVALSRADWRAFV
jgi:hypothetical protein